MTNAYRWVQWNTHKKTYDLLLAGACVAYLAVFVAVSMLTHPAPNDISPPILILRALATLALLLLHVVLLIGPLARFTDRAAPLLYNRRHLGVVTFAVALLHALLATLFYGGFGVRSPFTAVLAGYDSFASISGFPFEVLGAAALLILFVMAATSHDYWLATLSPRVWKSIHMLIYPAYALVVLHVALGALQSETSPVYAVLLATGVVCVSAAHLAAAIKENRTDARPAPINDGWITLDNPHDIEDGAARVVVCPGGARVAVFRDADSFSAISNVCAHQAGPLGEGRIIDGCVTCPWHGYQYDATNGQSPPPYTEKIPTYELRVSAGALQLNPSPNAPGTPAAPARLPEANA